MRYGHLLGGIILVIFVLSLSYAMKYSPANKVGAGTPPPTRTVPAASSSVYTTPIINSSARVIYTDAGFSPAVLTVSSGTVVFFENRSSSSFRPVSPDYPKRGACGASAMDPCGAVSESQIWTFQFDRKGSWPYYDLTQPQHVGTIIVK